MTFKSESARYDDGMAAAPIFGELLRKHLEERELSAAVFTRKLGFKSVTNFYNLLKGIRSPPPNKIEQMANILDLSEDERLDFFVLAALAHVPSKGPIDLRDYLTKTFQRLRVIEKRLKGG